MVYLLFFYSHFLIHADFKTIVFFPFFVILAIEHFLINAIYDCCSYLHLGHRMLVGYDLGWI